MQRSQQRAISRNGETVHNRTEKGRQRINEQNNVEARRSGPGEVSLETLRRIVDLLLFPADRRHLQWPDALRLHSRIDRATAHYARSPMQNLVMPKDAER